MVSQTLANDKRVSSFSSSETSVSSKPASPSSPQSLDANQIKKFRNRIQKELTYQTLRGNLPRPQPGSTLYSFQVIGNSEEKAYLAISWLHDHGFFPNAETLDIDDKNIQKSLAVGVAFFNNETLGSLGDKILALRIHKAYLEKCQLVKSEDPYQEKIKDVSKEMILDVAGTVSPALAGSVKLFSGIAELTRLYSYGEHSYPITKQQYHEIFGDSLPPETIPEFLLAGFALDSKLEIELLAQALKHQSAFIPRYLELAQEQGIHISPNDLDSLLARFQQTQLSGDELKKIRSEAQAAKKKLENTTRQRLINTGIDAAREVAHAVHAAALWEQDIENRRTRGVREMSAFSRLLSALEIKDFAEFHNKPLETVERMIEYRVLKAKAQGLDAIKASAEAYEKDVRTTREAIEKCRQQNADLKAPQAQMKKTADLIINYQKREEEHRRKIARGIRKLNILSDACRIIGTVASVIPGGQPVSAALTVAGTVGNFAAVESKRAHDKRWDANWERSQKHLSTIQWASETLSAISSGWESRSQMLALQRHQQTQALIDNPHRFPQHAYLRNLGEAYEDSQRNLKNLDALIGEAQTKDEKLQDMLNNLQPGLRKTEIELSRIKIKKTKERKRRLERLVQYQTRQGQYTAEQGKARLDIENWSSQREQEKARLEAIEARISQSAVVAGLPDHHKDGADRMQPKELLDSSDSWLKVLRNKRKELHEEILKLQSDPAQRSTTAAYDTLISDAMDRMDSCERELLDEQLFNIQVQRHLEIDQCQDNVGKSDLPTLVYTLRSKSDTRIHDLLNKVPVQEEILKKLADEEARAIAAVQAQQIVVDQLLTTSASGNFVKGAAKIAGSLLSMTSSSALPEQKAALFKLGELKDRLSDIKEKRQAQQLVCTEIDQTIVQEKIFKDAHLLRFTENLTLDQQSASSKQYLDHLTRAHEENKSMFKRLVEEERELSIELGSRRLSAVERKNLDADLQEVQQKKAVVESVLQIEDTSLRQESFRFYHLSHDRDVAQWEHTPGNQRPTLLKAIQANAYDRHNRLSLVADEAKRLKDFLKIDEERAQKARDTAQARLDEAGTSEAAKNAAHQALTTAQQKYEVVRKHHLDAAEALEQCEKMADHNEIVRKSYYASAYADEMQAMIHWFSTSSNNPHLQAGNEQWRQIISQFSQANVLKETGDVCSVLAWTSESVRNTPLSFLSVSRKSQVSFENLSHYFRAASAVATLGVGLAGKHEQAKTSWATRKGSGVSEIPGMGILDYCKEIANVTALAGTGNLFSLVNLTATAIGMLGNAYKRYHHPLPKENGLEEQFSSMKKYLEVFVKHLESRDEKVKKALQKHSKQLQTLNELIDSRSRHNQETMEAQNLRNQQIRVIEAVEFFKDAEAGLHMQGQDAYWLPKYLTIIDRNLSKANNEIYTGRNTERTTGILNIVTSPHFYIGLLARSEELEVPSVPLFNAVISSLVRVGEKLERGHQVDLSAVVNKSKAQGESIRRLAKTCNQRILDAKSALINFRKNFGERTLKSAFEKWERTLSYALEPSKRACTTTYNSLKTEKVSRIPFRATSSSGSSVPFFEGALEVYLNLLSNIFWSFSGAKTTELPKQLSAPLPSKQIAPMLKNSRTSQRLSLSARKTERITQSITPYKNALSYEEKIKSLYGAVQELVNRGENTPKTNPLFPIAATSLMIPAAAEGMVPLALPKQFIFSLRDKVQQQFLMLELTGQGTLIPYYEFQPTDSREKLTFSILFRHHLSGKQPTDFCRFSGIFSLDRACQNALTGLSGSELSAVQTSRMLMHAMYCGFLGLRMPGHNPHESKRIIYSEPVDLPFEGFYQKLSEHTYRGIHFQTAQFTEQDATVPQDWFSPTRLEILSEGEQILQRIQRKFLPTAMGALRSSAEFNDYKASYYEAMALVNFKYSLANTSKNYEPTIDQRTLALINLKGLFFNHGLPEPDESFDCFQQILETSVPNPKKLINKLDLYPPSRHYQEFLDNFENLKALSNSLLPTLEIPTSHTEEHSPDIAGKEISTSPMEEQDADTTVKPIQALWNLFSYAFKSIKMFVETTSG